jgi:hypothetical protein
MPGSSHAARLTITRSFNLRSVGAELGVFQDEAQEPWQGRGAASGSAPTAHVRVRLSAARTSLHSRAGAQWATLGPQSQVCKENTQARAVRPAPAGV